MVYYRFADDIGIGFNVFNSKDRLVAWFADEKRAVLLVESLKKEMSDDSVQSRNEQLATTARVQ